MDFRDECSDGTKCLFVESKVRREGVITIVAESFRTSYQHIRSTLCSIAEPLSRPLLVHEYRLTPFSLGAAVSNGLLPAEAMEFFDRYAYGMRMETGEPTSLYAELRGFITDCMSRYDLARIVIEGERTVVQCKNEETARLLLCDEVIRTTVADDGLLFMVNGLWKDEMGTFPSFLLKSRAMSKAVGERSVVLGYPIQQQYDYERDLSIRSANMSLRPQTKPRDYQVEAADMASSNGILNSGCLLLPCGAGKTLLGIMLMCKVKKSTLIVCAGGVSVEQWKMQILDYAILDPPAIGEDGITDGVAAGCAAKGRQAKVGAARISCLTGKQKDPITEDTDVVITTYSMLVMAHKAHLRLQAKRAAEEGDHFTDRGTRKRKQDPKEQLFASYGLLILDEVHVMPADAFRESLSFLDTKGVIGLTATYVREDQKILDLFHLVGPKLYDISMEALAAQGYLAKVNCVEVHTPMTKEFGLEYLDRSMRLGRAGHSPALVMLAAANPNKMLCVRELVHRHLSSGSKILLFCDHLLLLHEYGKLLGAPVICGETQHRDRLMIFSDFERTSKVNLVCVSRVGDVSVNLPNANVVIQVSSHGGSRRQEAQRLGRIMRPKERAAGGKSVEAWFYSIISMDTLEMGYAAHRMSFLVDQGYECRAMVYDPSPPEETAVKQAPSAKEEDMRVGDVASVKVEGAPGASKGSSTLRSTTAPTNDAYIRSLPYQLDILSKVVSSWEMQFQMEARKQQRGRGEEEEEAFSSDSDDVVIVEGDRSYMTIKRELGLGAQVDSRVVPLRHLVGVDDGFVYHEL